jgi:hypothetical protein
MNFTGKSQKNLFAVFGLIWLLILVGAMWLFAEPIDDGFFTNKDFFKVCCLFPLIVQIPNLILMWFFFRDFKQVSWWYKLVLCLPILWFPFACTMWVSSYFEKKDKIKQ